MCIKLPNLTSKAPRTANWRCAPDLGNLGAHRRQIPDPDAAEIRGGAKLGQVGDLRRGAPTPPRGGAFFKIFLKKIFFKVRNFRNGMAPLFWVIFARIPLRQPFFQKIF